VSFVEASASGLPIVSTRHNGLPDVILDEETGFLVEEGNSEEMGQKIAHLASNPERWNEIGRKGRMHMEERFDLSKQIEKMKGAYSGIKFR
jgi:colanic acid/amylovoran biosynthesis glycosyltransferase